MSFSKEQLQAARRTDLVRFLVANHPSEIKAEGNCLRLRSNHSLCIKRDYAGYTDFATGETGNAVDLLVRHFGYSVSDAVSALSEASPVLRLRRPDDSQAQHTINLPAPVIGQCRQLFAYLCKQRGFPADVVRDLLHLKLLYQAKEHNNIVFVNKERDFAEIHGSLSFGQAFHQCRKASPDRFWWFCSEPTATNAYICEAAIDAVSLYLLRGREPAYYISIAGVANQGAIDRIKRQPFLAKVVLAVDNDAAGDECRSRNPGTEYIIPATKDWNEDWLARL